ncbi:MAG: DUF1292 domain-containing protein [Firmicutes bacterium]|nr:DUF1292 domain-containing protein [Bacillota bacterium]
MSDDKLNIDDLNLFEGQDETYELVTMTEDDGTQTDFFVVDGIDYKDTKYLLLVKAEDFDKDEPDAFIFKEIETDGENCTYEPVEDDEEYNKILVLLQDEDAEYEMKF